LEDVDGIRDIGEEGIEGELVAEIGPPLPMGIGGGGAVSHDCVPGCVFRSAVITKERSARGGVHICQVRACG